MHGDEVIDKMVKMMRFSRPSSPCRPGRKAMLFTMDALLASMVLIAGLLLISKFLVKEPARESIEFMSSDVLSCLSELEMSDINSSFVTQNLSSNTTDMNLTVLEQLGTYWAAGQTGLAMALSSHLLGGLFHENTGINLTIGNDTLFNKSTSMQSDIFSGDRMITGVLQGAPITGSTSSAYLRRITDKRTSSIAYFGGFVGQGNITTFIDDLPSDVSSSSITSMEMELDAGAAFSLYINSDKCGDFTPSSQNMSPDYWNISSCSGSMATGRNDFRIEFSGQINKSYIAGGFIKINYITSERMQNLSIGRKRYYFPGIDGVVNLFDSFYIPGTLTNMSISLHFDSSSKTYLTIGDVVVYQDYPTGNTVIFMNDTNLTEFPINMNYEELSNRTIPLRFASYNETIQYVLGSNADVVLITDLSGSMKYRMNSWTNPGNAIPGCKDSDITDPSSRRLGVAACLDSQVNAIIMNSSRAGNYNRLWLVDFSDNANPFFSSNLALLTESNIENEITDRYKSKSQQEIKGGTCLCCAINQAYEILNTYSGNNRSKSVIVMSDGVPTYCCGGYWSGLSWLCNTTGTGTNKAWPGWWQSTSCTGDEADCSGSDCNGPMNNAINSAQRLHDDLNVTVYAVGFGPIENCTNANYTMSRIAEEGNGTVLVSGDGSALQEFYQNISFDILARVEQTSQLVTVEGGLTLSKLFNDSYIEFIYSPTINPPEPNEISILMKTAQFGTCEPIVAIPTGIRIADAKVVSYSDYHWTDALMIDGTTVYNLSSFSSDYVRLGDPYEIQVPPYLLTNGTHQVSIRTGDSPDNHTNCSMNNSLIYTALVPSSTSRSGVVEKTEGCIWTIQFEDDTYSNKSIPADYSGIKRCNYIAANHTLAQGAYDNTDAYDIAVYDLLHTLDFDDNGKVFVNLDAEDIEIVITTVSSVPYLWGPTLVKARVWQ